MTKLYAERDPDEIEPCRMRHLLAMTSEGLHSKADIADELAYRDKEIERLTQELTNDKDDINELNAEICGLENDVCKLEGKVEKLRNALQRLIDVAEQCDSWESFPSKALEDAEKALGDSNDH